MASDINNTTLMDCPFIVQKLKFLICVAICSLVMVHMTVLSRLTIVSREAKKSQRPLSELFTRNTTKKLANALAKPP